MPDVVLDNAWRSRIGLVVLTWLSIIGVYFATAADMVRIWSTSSTFNHCFLIVPIAFYLGFQHRDVFAKMAPSTSYLGVAFIALNSLLWLAGETMNIAFFGHLALVGSLIGAGWALIGNRVFGVLLFPFIYLYFSVPEGEFLVPYLQDWTALVLVELLQLTGVPVFLEGRFLSIPSGSFVVAEACSGINYLIATLAVGTMFMYLNFKSLCRRALFMLIAIMVPLIANGIRAYAIVMIADLSGYKYAIGVDHLIYGWVFFGVVIFALFALGNLFSDVDGASAPPSALNASVPGQPASISFALVMLICIVAPRAWLFFNDSNRPIAPLIMLPAVAGWSGPELSEPKLGMQLNGADSYINGVYRSNEGVEIIVEMAYLRSEEPGKELINQTHLLFDEERWKQIGHSTREPAPSSAIRDVGELQLREIDGSEDFLVWSWYDTGGERSAHRFLLKLAQARARLKGEHAGGAMVTLRTPAESQAQATKNLEAFLDGGPLALERLYVAE
jgi:exosortase A